MKNRSFFLFDNKTIALCTILLVSATLFSCDQFLEIESPKSKVSKDVLFSSDVTATSVVTGIYYDMVDDVGFSSGSNNSITAINGLSADELKVALAENATSLQFEMNALEPDNTILLNLWASMYKTIYEANSALEGLENSNNVTLKVKEHLMGEAYFIRAFAHFYLVNLFGDSPLIVSTDYLVNSKVSKSPKDAIYLQIVEDLQLAQSLLDEEYLNTRSGGVERVRPNKSTATALLSRVHLYLNAWANAEIQASAIIDNADTYSLVELNEVFLKNSNEAIWQLPPRTPSSINTFEGFFFVIEGAPLYNILNPELLDAFESGDRRMVDWVGSFSDGTDTFYFSYKYKVQQSEEVSEYSMVFRLAEQYLIRAEARAQQNNLAGAIEDLDKIRERADLQLLIDTNPSIDKGSLLLAIERERRTELFTEWGHRWLDLKRNARLDEVMTATKGALWQSTDALYPIPQSEILSNRNLLPQNSGY